MAFYQLPRYTDDVDLNEKLRQWKDYYNADMPHASLVGKIFYEVLRERLAG